MHAVSAGSSATADRWTTSRTPLAGVGATAVHIGRLRTSCAVEPEARRSRNRQVWVCGLTEVAAMAAGGRGGGGVLGFATVALPEYAPRPPGAEIHRTSILAAASIGLYTAAAGWPTPEHLGACRSARGEIAAIALAALE